MVLCSVFGCSERSDRKKSGKSFYRIPGIISHQGDAELLLSSERRKRWFVAIKRADMKEDSTSYRICSDHFISGKLTYIDR